MSAIGVHPRAGEIEAMAGDIEVEAGEIEGFPGAPTMANPDPPIVNDQDTNQENHQVNEPSEGIDNVEDLIEHDPLIMLFGDHPRARIIMALLNAYPQPMNPSSIVDQANVSRQSWYRHQETLLKTGLVEEVAKAGNSPLYALVDIDDDLRVEWLQKLRDWTATYRREGRRPTRSDEH